MNLPSVLLQQNVTWYGVDAYGNRKREILLWLLSTLSFLFVYQFCLSWKTVEENVIANFFLQINRKAWYFFSKKHIQFANPILNMGTSLKFEIIARGRCLMRKASVRVLCRGTTIPGSWRIGKTKKRRGWSLVKCPASVRLQPQPVLYSNENGMRLSPCCDAIARVAALLKTGCSPLDEHFFW